MSRKLFSYLFLGMISVFMTIAHMDDAMADKLCFFSANGPLDHASNPQCLQTDMHTDLPLSWVSDLTHLEALPTMISLEGIFASNRFSPQRSYVNYEPLQINQMSAAAREEKRNPQVSPLLPLYTNVLGRLTASLFSTEGRVRLSQENGLISLSCQAGKAAAGLVLAPTQGRFPKLIDYYVTVQGAADKPFQIGLAAQNGTLSSSAPTFPIRYGTSGPDQPKYDVLRFRNRPNANDVIMVQCPDQQAHIDLASIRIEPLEKAENDKGLATWIWRDQDWIDNPDGLIDWAKARSITKFFVQIGIENDSITNEAALIAFIKAARRNSIDVFAVEGDARMIRGEGRRLALQRTRVIADFQNRMDVTAKLSGIQYDIEPYTSDEFAADPTAMWDDWATTLNAMHTIWGGPIDIVTPYWMRNTAEGVNALDKVKDIGSFTVMAYRTTRSQIFEVSRRWLVWGATAGARINIALENGPVDGKAQMFFKRSEEQTPQAAQPFILLLRTTNSGMTSILYSLDHINQPDGNDVSFLGETGDLFDTLARIRPYFATFSSFGGFAIHGLR
ncbi:hypothetical protein [Bartonella sp. LJL80]